ncbi:MAG: hypothetical protein ACI8RZ_003391, partial [Myxococcota bacterium]
MRCVMLLSLLAGCIPDVGLTPFCEDKSWFFDEDHDGFGDESKGEMSDKD